MLQGPIKSPVDSPERLIDADTFTSATNGSVHDEKALGPVALEPTNGHHNGHDLTNLKTIGQGSDELTGNEAPSYPFRTKPGARLSKSSEERSTLVYVEGSNVFSKMPIAKYYVGIMAIGKQVYLPEEYRAFRRLRRLEYYNREWIEPDNHDVDYGEHDEFDDQAIQIGTFKNTKDGALIIGGDRLILKNNEDKPLPVEQHFDFFKSNPASVGATEISRHMSRSPDKIERALAEIAQIRAMIGVGTRKGFTHAYGMIEQPLARLMSAKNLNHDMLSDFIPIPEYGDTNNALILVEPQRLLDGVRFRNVFRKEKPVDLKTAYVFADTKRNQGIGFYSHHFAVNLGNYCVGKSVIHDGGVKEELRRYVEDHPLEIENSRTLPRQSIVLRSLKSPTVGM